MRDDLEKLGSLVLDILHANPQGLSEYDLIKALGLNQATQFTTQAFRDNLSLFRVHFLLFHTLYRLRESLCRDQLGRLDIDPLKIVLRPYIEGEQGAVAACDPLCNYYSDLSNLDDTTADDINELLGSFWTRFYSQDRRREALAVLGLRDPVDEQSIKRQYRRLVMLHHPDRGGDKEAMQDIQAAMVLLTKKY